MSRLFCPPLARRCLLTLVIGLASAGAARAAAPPLQLLDHPRAVKADAAGAKLVRRLLDLSPTFRAQCERLDATDRLVVILRFRPDLPTQFFRARSTMHRYSSGLLVAHVDLTPGAQQAMWIAHEFEHVLEQVEGLRLTGRESGQADGAWRTDAGMVETSRAVRIGRIVQQEFTATDGTDAFVE